MDAGDEELDWEAISAQMDAGDEEPDWEAIGARLNAFDLEDAEEVAALAAARAGVVTSSRNCRRRRDDTNDQHSAQHLERLLQNLRDHGWEPLLLAATKFCDGRNIIVPNMTDNIPARGYPRISRKVVTCLHYYKIEIFNEVLDRNMVEMNNRFSETSTRLLICTACLDPRDSFSNFDHEKLIELANIYSVDFSSHDCYVLVDQLNIYIDMMKSSPDFLSCDTLGDLSLKLVQTRRHLIFPLVYRLITLALTLPVATASVERFFSSMKIVKTDLRNKIGDDWFGDLMICYSEKEIFQKIDEKKIMLRFHALGNRRGHLPRKFHLASTTTT